MELPRRDFVKDLVALGMLPAFAPIALAASELLQRPGAAAQLAHTDGAAFGFWSDFLTARSVPSPTVKVAATRGKSSTGVDREAFFFHYTGQGLQPAMDLPTTAMLPGGDVTVSANVVAFRPGAEDRATFERLQNAQLRLDFVQTKPIFDLIDTMAWTALAALHPDRAKKLPPIQNLSFDPGTTSQKMQNIVLPGGQGLWAVNLYAQQKDSFFTQLLGFITKEVDRFAPVLGLPGISVAALQSFNAFYGALHSGTEYLFQSNPVPVFATVASLNMTTASQGLPLVSGTYVLVPVVHAETLTPDVLAPFDLRQGLIVPKNTIATQIASAAAAALPNVTYATIDITVKPVQISTATGRSGGAGSKSTADPSASSDDASPTPKPAAPPAGGRGRGGTPTPTPTASPSPGRGHT